MAFSLSPPAIEAGYRLEAFDTVGSTNALALERVQAGDPGRLWLASAHQQAGRGRRGRAWQTEPGNLAATLLLVLDRDSERAATLGFVAGVALADALNAAVPGVGLQVGPDGGRTAGGGRFELKWPNDVLAGSAKLSGILLESTLTRTGRLAVAIGIGVNVVTHPDGLPYPTTSLHALGANVSAEEVFAQLSDSWVSAHAEWQAPRGLAEIRRRWLDHAAGLGSEVAVRLADRVVRGKFETIDQDCRLVIRLPDGQQERISAGDVHFGAVASVPAA